MKRLFCSILILLLLCGCNSRDTASETRADIKINFPTDNTVNGYRTEVVSGSTSEFPDSIPTENVKPETNITTGKILYYGNSNSHIFHKTDCSSISKTDKKKLVGFKSKNDALAKDYKPCKRCNP